MSLSEHRKKGEKVKKLFVVTLQNKAKIWQIDVAADSEHDALNNAPNQEVGTHIIAIKVKPPSELDEIRKRNKRKR